MSNFNNGNHSIFILDFVKDSVISLPQSVSFLHGKFDATGGAGDISQLVDPSQNSDPVQFWNPFPPL